MQKLELDPHGVIRFRENAIVAYLLYKGPFDLNYLSGLSQDSPKGFTKHDWRQFAQLIGYSADGYCTLSYVSRAEAHRVDYAVSEFMEKHGRADRSS